MDNCISLVLEVLTAVGTIGAAIVALWIAVREDYPKVSGIFAWSTATKYQPTLLVQNVGKQIAVIESVEVIYNHKLIKKIVFSEEYSLRDFAIIEAGDIKHIPFESEWLRICKPKDETKPFTLKVVTKLLSGSKSVSKQKYSYTDLRDLFFGMGLHSGMQ